MFSGEQQAPPKAADDHEPLVGVPFGSFEARLRAGRVAGMSPALKEPRSQRRASATAIGVEVRNFVACLAASVTLHAGANASWRRVRVAIRKQ